MIVIMNTYIDIHIYYIHRYTYICLHIRVIYITYTIYNLCIVHLDGRKFKKERSTSVQTLTLSCCPWTNCITRSFQTHSCFRECTQDARLLYLHVLVKNNLLSTHPGDSHRRYTEASPASDYKPTCLQFESWSITVSICSMVLEYCETFTNK